MNPTREGAEQIHRVSGRPAARTAAATRGPDLDLLSQAGVNFTRGTPERTRPRLPSILLALAAGAIVGAVVVFAAPFEYRAAVSFRLTQRPTPEARAGFRADLLDFAWKQIHSTREPASALRQPEVGSDESGMVSLSAVTLNRTAGAQELRTIAEGFIEQDRRRREVLRNTPTQAELILGEINHDLQARMQGAAEQVDAAIAAMPATDPSAHREALMERWKSLRSNLSAAREELAAAASQADQLKSEPPAAFAVVSAEQRRAALEADDALQQDLKELAVHLTALKLHLLNVWQKSAGPVERLIADTGEFQRLAPRPAEPSSDVSPGTGASAAAGPARMADSLEAYQDGLQAFNERWDREFTALKLLKVDPLSGEILDAFQRIRRTLNDFLFESGKRLSTLRELVRAAGDDPSDAARRHVYYSGLTRAFQTIEASHHRFEFAAGTIETPENFRLDAALTSARGLRRRSQDRLHGIEETLQTAATERANKRRLEALGQAESAVERVRSTTDSAVDELMALQEELNLSAGLTEGFLRATLRAEVAATRLELLRTDLRSCGDRLAALVERRTAGDSGLRAELAFYGVEDRPANLVERLRSGGLGAVLAFFSVFFGQWWVARPR